MSARIESDVLTVVEWNRGDEWDVFVSGAQDGTIAHRWPWLGVIADTYGHTTHALAAVQNGTLRGVLPLALVDSRLFGRRLVSMPYGDRGGICCNGDLAAQGALLQAALRLAAAERASLELRHSAERDYPLPVSTHKVTMLLDLSGGERQVWQRIKSNRRGQVRKAERNGLTVEVCGASATPAFFSVLATNMRDLGSPVHRSAFFDNVLSAFGPDAAILLVRSPEGRAIGAGLVLVHGACTVLPFSSSLRSMFSLGPNQLLYWEAIRFALDRGCAVFDFGRSSPGSGTFEAKREWGATPLQLHWYHTRRGSDDDASSLAWAPRVWRHLPVPVATAVSHFVRGGLPQ